MKLTLREHVIEFAQPGDRIIWPSGMSEPMSLVLRVGKNGGTVTTPWRWWHWLVRWFL